MPTVVIAYDTFPDIHIEQEILKTIGATVVHTHNLTSPEALEAAKRADAVMVTIQKVTADIIAMMQNCKIICRVGTGLDAIDIPAATQRGIWVTNVGDYSVEEVSTHTVLMLLVFARRLMPMLDSVKQGKWWNPATIEPAYRLTEQTLGLLGYGRIGKATAAKARGLGLNVIVHDPYVSAANGVRMVDFDTLLRESDYLSLHVPLTDSTRYIINTETLAKMKRSAVLINAARGPLVDEDALLAAVRSGAIAGAAIDVFAVEPPPPDHPFLHEERILVTPHAAWYSEPAKHDVRVKGAQDVVRVLRGEKPVSAVNQL